MLFSDSVLFVPCMEQYTAAPLFVPSSNLIPDINAIDHNGVTNGIGCVILLKNSGHTPE